MNPAPRAEIRVVETAFADDVYFDTAVSAALMRQVARGEIGPTSVDAKNTVVVLRAASRNSALNSVKD